MTLPMATACQTAPQQCPGAVQGRVVSIGIEAQSVISTLESASVVGVFKNSLYLRSGDAWACLGHRSIGRGPLNITCETAGCADWREISALGDVPRPHSAGFALGPLVLAVIGASVWQRCPEPLREVRQLERGLEVLIDCLPADLPSEGLACYLCGQINTKSAVARAARQPIETLIRWLRKDSRGESRSPAARKAVRSLLGLGPGLTPSGDDFLAGLVVGLRAAGRAQTAQALAREIISLAPLCTNEISAAHLLAALRAGLREDLEDVLRAALQGDDRAVRTGLQRLDRHAHYSPWDALAGVRTAFQGVLGPPMQRVPVYRN